MILIFFSGNFTYFIPDPMHVVKPSRSDRRKKSKHLRFILPANKGKFFKRNSPNKKYVSKDRYTKDYRYVNNPNFTKLFF